MTHFASGTGTVIKRPVGQTPALPPATLQHLRQVLDEPDLTGAPYTLGERLGSGGMGTVYLAHDERLDRDVAIKVLHWPAGDDLAAPRLLREARIIAQLDHPGIVPIYDVGTLADGRAYYAMRRVSGRPLRAIRTDELPLDRRLRIFERIGEAVSFAHAKGIWHRDLKPENIMVGSFGEVLVMDWGVALGTPGYMAPEQAEGQDAIVDGRTDIYALGAVLRFLATGAVPGEQSSAAAASPARLRAIWQKAMATAPADRYPDAAAMSDDVARFLAREPVAAYAENPIERLIRLVAKHRAAVLLVLAYLAMRVALILITGR